MGDEPTALQDISVGLPSLKRQMSVMECEYLTQVMIEPRNFLELSFTKYQKVASVAKFHREKGSVYKTAT